jgi:hypothetical protein
MKNMKADEEKKQRSKQVDVHAHPAPNLSP